MKSIPSVNSNVNSGNNLNREKVCPLLLRVFIKEDSFHSPDEFKSRSVVPEKDEIQVYTWKNSTLREITTLIKEVNLNARKKESKLNFAFIYPDTKGVFQIKQIGSVHSSKKGDDDHKTLEDLDFNYQYLDVSLITGSSSS
eukprot:gene439-555_t